MSTTSVAEFENVTKVYRDAFRRGRDIEALKGVSFQIARGEVFGLLGPNRAGKTTLIKILLCLCRPSGGTVRRLGRPSADRTTLTQVGYMHENQAFPRYLTAVTLLQYYGALSGVSQAALAQRVPQLLERVGLADRSDEPIARFSKGMVQRLALAQALINDPELLVLDEPTEGLDLLARRVVYDVIAELQRRERTVLLVSHQLTDVDRLCGRVAIVVEGQLVQQGPLSALTGHHQKETDRPIEAVLQSLYEKTAS